MKRLLLAVLLVVLIAPAPPAFPSELLLATTTSVRDSGLLDALLPLFSEETGIRVRPVAVGSGAALRMAEQGNADVLVTHAPGSEDGLRASGAVISRVPFMENYFVIAGAPADPAGVAQATSAADALRLIRDAGAPYISRGDDSGTHMREVELLKAAGVDSGRGWPGYTSTGAGMGLSLQVAGERRAYILSDIGTFLAFARRTGLVVLSRPEAALRNEYSVLRVNPERFPGVKAPEALLLETFLLRPDIQQRIGEFGRERFGQPLFHPLLEERREPPGPAPRPHEGARSERSPP